MFNPSKLENILMQFDFFFSFTGTKSLYMTKKDKKIFLTVFHGPLIVANVIIVLSGKMQRK